MTAEPTCAICFEPVRHPNYSCPVPETHAVPLIIPDMHVDPFTWGKVRGHEIHWSCATEEETMLTWALVSATRSAAGDRLCEVCQKPLAELP